MRINIKHLVIGRIKIGNRVIDLYNLQIRDELSSDSIRKYAIECAEKIKRDPRYESDKSKIETFYGDLLESVQFFSVEPDWTDTAKIYFSPKRPILPKAIITMPNDYGPAEAKGSTFHETIHFLGNYTDPILFWDENLVNNMVDLYLCDDKDALFERRWLQYILTPKMKIARTVISMTIGFIIGSEIGKGYLNFAVLALIGGITCYKLFKRMKRESLISC